MDRDERTLRVPPRIRAVFFDLDGTLLSPDSELRPVVLAVLDSLKEAGVAVGLATGRLYESTKPYAEQVRCTAPIVLLNGARVVGPSGQPCYYQAYLPAHVGHDVIAEARQRHIHVNLYWEDRYFVEDLGPYGRAFVDKEHYLPIVVEDLEAKLSRDPVKLLLIGEPRELEACRRVCLERLGERVQMVFSEPNFLEVLPPGVTKGTALERAAKLLEIPLSEIAAFGDGPNDADMLARAGVGIAVANARREARAAADFVTRGTHDTGVLEGLSLLFPGLRDRTLELREAAE